MENHAFKAIWGYASTLYGQREFDLDYFINLHSPKQIEYINCQAPIVMYFGGRRAGKTLGSSSKCVTRDKALIYTPNARIVFASATIDKTKSLYWRLFQNINKKMDFGWQFSSGENKILTGRYEIVFRGLKDIPSADLDMGMMIEILFLEEPQTIREKILKHYLENVISWGQTGVRKAQVNICGNPPPFPMPYLFNLYKNENVYKIKTTMWDNPSLSKQDIQNQLKKTADFMGYSSVIEAQDDPVFQRNVFGNWVFDTSLMVFNKERIIQEDFTPEDSDWKDFKIVLGVDIGGGSADDAIAVLGWNQFIDKIYIFEEHTLTTKDKDIEDLAVKIKKITKSYEDKGCSSIGVSLDTGGLGNRIAEILRTKYGVTGVVPAKKQEKLAYLAELRTEAYKGRLVFRTDSRLAEEMPQIVYTPDRRKLDDVEGLHSDLLDASLYAFRLITSKFVKKQEVQMSYEEKRALEKIREMNKTPKFSGRFSI